MCCWGSISLDLEFDVACLTSKSWRWQWIWESSSKVWTECWLRVEGCCIPLLCSYSIVLVWPRSLLCPIGCEKVVSSQSNPPPTISIAMFDLSKWSTVVWSSAVVGEPANMSLLGGWCLFPMFHRLGKSWIKLGDSVISSPEFESPDFHLQLLVFWGNVVSLG